VADVRLIVNAGCRIQKRLEPTEGFCPLVWSGRCTGSVPQPVHATSTWSVRTRLPHRSTVEIERVAPRV